MKKKRDILFLCQFFYPEYISSATLPYDTAVGLSEEGFSVDVLCGYPKEYIGHGSVPNMEDINGIRIKRLRYWQLKRTNILGRIINYFSFFFKVLLNLRCFKFYDAIVVYSNPPILPYVAYLAKKMFKCKLIFVSYDLYPEIAICTNVMTEAGITSKIMRHINRRVFTTADAVVALSTEMKEFIKKNRDIEATRVHVIPNWYKDCKNEICESNKNNKFYEEYHDKIVACYLGNMGICQDVETIISAAKKLKNDDEFRFLFAGHGNKVEYIKRIINEYELNNVKILDFLHGKDYNDALACSSFAFVSLEKGLAGLCVPSKTYAYLMAGIPVIAISDAQTDISADAAYVCRNGDNDGLVNFLLNYKKTYSDEQIKVLRKHSRTVYLKKYETTCCIDKYKRLFYKILR